MADEALKEDIRDLRRDLKETDRKVTQIDKELARALIFVGQFKEFEKKLDVLVQKYTASMAKFRGGQEMSRMYVTAISGTVSAAITLLGIWIAWNAQG